MSRVPDPLIGSVGLKPDGVAIVVAIELFIRAPKGQACCGALASDEVAP